MKAQKPSTLMPYTIKVKFVALLLQTCSLRPPNFAVFDINSLKEAEKLPRKFQRFILAYIRHFSN